MAEIKSTLDIVMEKTKHLRLSSEERHKQQSVEVEQKIKGLLQKFQDQILSEDQLSSEYGGLKKTYNLSDNSILINEVFSRLDSDRDNRRLLTLLKKQCGANVTEIKSILNDYEDELNSAASYRRIELRETLAQTHFISGSAVVPNLQADEQWQAERTELRAKFGKRLDETKNKLECK